MIVSVLRPLLAVAPAASVASSFALPSSALADLSLALLFDLSAHLDSLTRSP